VTELRVFLRALSKGVFGTVFSASALAFVSVGVSVGSTNSHGWELRALGALSGVVFNLFDLTLSEVHEGSSLTLKGTQVSVGFFVSCLHSTC